MRYAPTSERGLPRTVSGPVVTILHHHAADGFQLHPPLAGDADGHLQGVAGQLLPRLRGGGGRVPRSPSAGGRAGRVRA
jgi:hypothetical protein